MSHFNVEVDYWTVAIDRIVQAAGLAFLFIPINTAAYVGVPPAKNNNASALINLARNLGGSVGIAVLTTLVARRSQVHQNNLVGNVSAADPQYQALVGQLQERMLMHGGDAAQALHKAQSILGPPRLGSGADAGLHRLLSVAGRPVRRAHSLRLPDEAAEPPRRAVGPPAI